MSRRYYQFHHVQSTSTADTTLTVQLPVTATGKPGLWQFHGFTFVKTAGGNATSCVVAFGNKSGFTVNGSHQFYYKTVGGLSTSSFPDWNLDSLGIYDSGNGVGYNIDPLVFVPDSNGRIYIDLNFNHGNVNNKWSVTCTFEQLKGSQIESAA